MKIQSLQYEDLSTGWKLEKIEFNPQLTLLVGASGVGKTQILKALLNLKEIAQGSWRNGIVWKIKFTTEAEHFCVWSGKFENKSIISESPRLENEKLIINNSLIVDRDTKQIFFNKKPTVKLPQDESILSLLKEEEQIKKIHHEFEKLFCDISYEDGLDKELNATELPKEDEILNQLRNSNKRIHEKLYFLYTKERKCFDELKNSFIEIFPSIEDLKIEVDIFEISYGPFITIHIKIKEKNVQDWIDEKNISSGMYKTLIYIDELYLCPNNSVILIDEFENSLGINCIDEVVYQMLASERDLQFIITSHHPYIINKIPYQDWKLVTRKGSVVQAKNATDYGIGKSRLQAFTQLGNLPEFSAGIES